MKINHQHGHTTGLGDTTCPSPDALLRYTDRALHRMGANDVSFHLERCGSCAKLAGLIGSPTAGPVPVDLSPVERQQDRDLVARSLGFRTKRSLIKKLLGLADSLWQVRTPILVPVSTTALLLFLLLPVSRPAAIKEAAPPVHHFADWTRMITTDLNLRSTSGQGASCHAAAGSLVILQHDARRSGLATGDPVSVVITSRTDETTVLRSSVSETGLIEVPLIFLRSGRYQVRLTGEDNGVLLSVIHCTVTSPPSPTS